MCETVRRYGSIVLGGIDYIDSVILPMIHELHMCTSVPRWERLLCACLAKWEADKQDAFIKTWRASYLYPKWRNWLVGSLPIVGLGITNNPLESFNKVVKQVVIRVSASFQIICFICMRHSLINVYSLFVIDLEKGLCFSVSQNWYYS